MKAFGPEGAEFVSIIESATEKGESVPRSRSAQTLGGDPGCRTGLTVRPEAGRALQLRATRACVSCNEPAGEAGIAMAMS